MPQLYSVRIKYADDNSEHDVVICDYDCVPDGVDDDDIFFFGLSRESIERIIKNDELCENEWYILELYGEVES